MGFDVGDIVALRDDPTWIGGVIEVMPTTAGTTRCRVFYGADLIRTYPDHRLVKVPNGPHYDGRGATFGEFRLRLLMYLDALQSRPDRPTGHPWLIPPARFLAARGRQVVAAHLHVVDQDGDQGDYLFAVDTWNIQSLQPELLVVAVAVDLDELAPAPAVADRLLHLLAKADGSHRATDARVQPARAVLETHARRQRQAAASAATDVNATRLSRRLALWQECHEHAAQELNDRGANDLDPETTRTRAAQHEQADLTYQQRRQALERHRPATISHTRIAEGLLNIVSA